jgi:hypothetical protein
MSRRLLIFLVLAPAVFGQQEYAAAGWMPSGSGSAAVKADGLPTGPVPALSKSGANVTVTWPQVFFADGTAVGGYVVHRYRASDNTEFAVGAGCSGTVSGTSCTENGVATGTWVYRIEPVRALWRGALGAGASIGVGRANLTGLQILNASGGQTGRAEPGDTVVVTFDDYVDVASFCSTWSGNTSNQSVTADNVVSVRLDNAAVNGHDKLSVSTTSAACGGAFKWGYIDLGTNGYTNPTGATFAGTGAGASTITWSAAAKTLTIKLGALSGASSRVNASFTATYTPDPANTSNGSQIIGTVSDTAIHF